MAGKAQHHVLVFEINTSFTRYALFADGRMGIPGTFATPNTDGNRVITITELVDSGANGVIETPVELVTQ